MSKAQRESSVNRPRRRRGRPSKLVLSIESTLLIPGEIFSWEEELLQQHLSQLVSVCPTTCDEQGEG